MRSCIARQPIFDRSERVCAYELLFRLGPSNSFEPGRLDPSLASYEVIHRCLNVFGLAELTGGRKAFVNVAPALLLEEHVRVLPPHLTVLEILEDVEPDPGVIEACAQLRHEGYTLALDDFRYDRRYEPLLDLADIVKVDVLKTSPEQQEDLVERLSPRGIALVAEKVENLETYRRTRGLGFRYFQGYFFCQPITLSREDVPTARGLCLRLLKEALREDFAWNRVLPVLDQDAGLASKLLRYVHSFGGGVDLRLSRLEEAFALLGEKRFRRWLSVTILGSLGEEKADERLLQALVRARLCERLGPVVGLEGRENDLFWLGLFSLLDAMFGRPMREVLEGLPLVEEVRQTLLGKSTPLRSVLDYVLAYERGQWNRAGQLGAALHLDGAQASGLYGGALEWARSAWKEEAVSR